MISASLAEPRAALAQDMHQGLEARIVLRCYSWRGQQSSYRRVTRIVAPGLRGKRPSSNIMHSTVGRPQINEHVSPGLLEGKVAQVPHLSMSDDNYKTKMPPKNGIAEVVTG
jgi:hypothetical protein